MLNIFQRTVTSILTYSGELRRNFYKLSKIYEKFLSKRFVLHNEVLISKDILHNRSMLDALREDYRKSGGLRWTDKYLRDCGIFFVCETIGFDNAISMLKVSGTKLSNTDRSRNSRLVARMRDAMFKFGVAKNLSNSGHPLELQACFNHLKAIIRK